MEITKSIIEDLLPIYLTGECSADTKQLIEEYLKSHPELQGLLESYDTKEAPVPVTLNLTPDDEMRVLNRTKTLLRRRSYFMGFAIFFTLLPFSFMVKDGTFQWLVLHSFKSTITYAILALIFWTAYLTTKKKI